ncbi:hypothetical protein D3C76_1349410 [compost metagenome]
MAIEIGAGKLQAVLGGAKLDGCAQCGVPGGRVGRLRAGQGHGQGGIVTAQTVATGTHIDRNEGIDGFGRRWGGVLRKLQAKQIAALFAAQLQDQRIADYLVVTHDPFEHFAQAATGYQCITQGVERSRADEARHPQANGRVAAGFHRQLPQARSGR